MINKILIVEDNQVNLDIFTEILEDDFDLKIAMDGQQALDVIEDYMPDVVLLDVMMPTMNGYEVCEKIRSNAQLKDIKVIMVSARAMNSERKKGMESGADEYITKPFDEEVLMDMVKSCVNERTG
ncbi:hypothetical protein MNBD_GAMMA23-1166 [hydrothermal vent metagenome]|uniref:Response regulatory domain-containing protein n=1 Tax=hydrothermal vent metagenome TaxID=652676 RepID=A0A3B1A951_9ZZZZ